MSIRINIEKKSSNHININVEKDLNQSFETLKINLPRTKQTKNNNLSQFDKNPSKLIDSPKINSIQDRSYILSEDKTIREILENELFNIHEKAKLLIKT